MLEQRAASRLMRTAHKVRRPIHFDRNPLPIVQGNERVDAVPGNLATMLILYTESARADFSHHFTLELRWPPFFKYESFVAGLP